MTVDDPRFDELDTAIDHAAARLIVPVDDPAFVRRVVAALPDRSANPVWRLPVPAWQVALALTAVAAVSFYVNRPAPVQPLPASTWTAASRLVRSVAPEWPLVDESAVTAPSRRRGTPVIDGLAVDEPKWGVAPLSTPAVLALASMVVAPIELTPPSLQPLAIDALTVHALSFTDFEE
jgi:hypothetical protein